MPTVVNIAVTETVAAGNDPLSTGPSQELIVLRPDRYVAAVCSRDGLGGVTRALRALLD